jgi:hypothetical protein
MDNIAAMGDNYGDMTQIVPKKSQLMREIAELLGIPEVLPTVGSSIPSVFFTSVASEMGVPIVPGMPSLARKIIESSHLTWRTEFSSEAMPSGGGGTVTALGLMQVKNAVLIWKGEPAQPLPIEIEEGDWEPSQYWQAIREELPRETQEVIARPGATEFRNQVLYEYANRCAVSGITSTEALEVAHIVPYYGPDSDDIQNAIPLRVDIHRLFDRGLIRIEYSETSKSYKIRVHDFISKDYKEFDGKSLLLPDGKNSVPSKNAIDFHNNQFSELWTVI